MTANLIRASRRLDRRPEVRSDRLIGQQSASPRVLLYFIRGWRVFTQPRPKPGTASYEMAAPKPTLSAYSWGVDRSNVKSIASFRVLIAITVIAAAALCSKVPSVALAEPGHRFDNNYEQ
jgi:hypothetical protein